MNGERNLRRTRDEQQSVTTEDSDVRSRPPSNGLTDVGLTSLLRGVQIVHVDSPELAQRVGRRNRGRRGCSLLCLWPGRTW
jgi:hypothetical protein